MKITSTMRVLNVIPGSATPLIASATPSKGRQVYELEEGEILELEGGETCELEEGEIYQCGDLDIIAWQGEDAKTELKEGEKTEAPADPSISRHEEPYSQTAVPSRRPNFHPSSTVRNGIRKIKMASTSYQNLFHHKSAHKRHRERCLGVPSKGYHPQFEGYKRRGEWFRRSPARTYFKNKKSTSRLKKIKSVTPPACEPGEILHFEPDRKHMVETDPWLKSHYQVILDDKYKVKDLPDHFATLVITTHPVTDIAIPIETLETQMQVQNTSVPSVPSFLAICKLINREAEPNPERASLMTFDTDRIYETADGQKSETFFNCWRENSCVGVQTPKLLHKNTLHVLDPDNPKFRRKLTPEAYRNLLFQLDNHLLSQHSSSSDQSSSQSSPREAEIGFRRRVYDRWSGSNRSSSSSSPRKANIDPRRRVFDPWS